MRTINTYSAAMDKLRKAQNTHFGELSPPLTFRGRQNGNPNHSRPSCAGTGLHLKRGKTRQAAVRPGQVRSGHSGSGRVSPGRVRSGRVSSGHGGSGRGGSGQIRSDSDKARSGQVESGQAKSDQAGLSQVGLEKAGAPTLHIPIISVVLPISSRTLQRGTRRCQPGQLSSHLFQEANFTL